uniref:Serine/threonine-protein kinase RIO1 n=1 Tax=Crassostrea virginica TaxID=6565 RepID=A0A8B8CI53_CRAVI|nr:serine/threonine-protein kinase RIO1-like [Crassostrea virginica]
MSSFEVVEGQFDDVDEDLKITRPGSQSSDDATHIRYGTNENIEDDEEDYEDEDDDDIYDWDGCTGNFTKKYNAATSNTSRPNANPPKQKQQKMTSYQPPEKTLSKFVDKINVEKYEGPVLPNAAASALVHAGRKMDSDRTKSRDKKDRATAEQVMDPRTRMILFKFLQRGLIAEINGCISTGKEANVYHATTQNQGDRAIKVYKTSILVFKDRDKYVTGEFRFRHGYCKHNPRKMVRTWAEKEMRNLSRMYQAGLPCPEPIFLKSHVLVMRFIGTDGWPAPLLKDCDISETKARELYLECIHIIRTMYHTCRLIHADLSEFNMLYHNGGVYVIDVSQSVEHDHPCALEFLRKDCTNITEFFKKKNVSVLTVKELFDFVTDATITEDNIDLYLEKAMTLASQRTTEDITEQQKVDEEVFKHSFIPRNLDEVIDFERDVILAKEGQTEGMLYHTLTGLQENLEGVRTQPALLAENEENGSNSVKQESEEEEEEEDSGSGSEEEEEDTDGKGDNSKQSISRPKNETSEDRRERKKEFKEEKREKRKNKIPKHIKKRKEKMGRQGKKTLKFNMISWIWTQIKKHRRKFIYGGIVFGGVYVAYRYAHNRIKEIQEKEANECLTHARRQHHFDSNQRTCNMTVLSMVSNLREILQQLFDTEAITETLKSNPSNKLELWEELKILSVTRMVCVVYASSMMSLLIRIQLNVIGGYIYLQNNNTSTQSNERTESVPGQPTVIPKPAQEKYLSEIKHFMDKGICQLGELIQSAVKKEISSISLKERLTFHNVESCLQHIRERLESSPEISSLSSPTLQLCPYMFPPENSTQTATKCAEDEIHERLMQETRDILESADFHTVLKTSLDRGFQKLLDFVADAYKTSLQSTEQNSSHNTEYLQGGIPMAKLIPIFNGSLYKLCSDPPNPLLQELLLLESAKTLAANVYEAFSQPPL